MGGAGDIWKTSAPLSFKNFSTYLCESKRKGERREGGCGGGEHLI